MFEESAQIAALIAANIFALLLSYIVGSFHFLPFSGHLMCTF